MLARVMESWVWSVVVTNGRSRGQAVEISLEIRYCNSVAFRVAERLRAFRVSEVAECVNRESRDQF